MFSIFFFNWTLDPPTHFQSVFGILELFFIYMAPKYRVIYYDYRAYCKLVPFDKL